VLAQLQFLSIWEVLMAIVDICVVAYVLYRALVLIRGTRAVQLIKGILLLLILAAASRFLRLYTVNWLLEKAQVMLLVALPIVFQPELRRALEQLGRGRLFARSFLAIGEEEWVRIIGEVATAVGTLSRHRLGALIVVERETGLNEVIENGTRIDALVSNDLLVNLFVPNTPLHDGAAVLRGDRVMAAGCFLPLTENPEVDRSVGTRHRAAIGITEHSDAVSVVVSEETGVISLANGGKLYRELDVKALREMLTTLCVPSRRAGGVRPFGLGGRSGG
jgi:diadenylate cyclase